MTLKNVEKYSQYRFQQSQQLLFIKQKQIIDDSSDNQQLYQQNNQKNAYDFFDARNNSIFNFFRFEEYSFNQQRSSYQNQQQSLYQNQQSRFLNQNYVENRNNCSNSQYVYNEKNFESKNIYSKNKYEKYEKYEKYTKSKVFAYYAKKIAKIEIEQNFTIVFESISNYSNIFFI